MTTPPVSFVKMLSPSDLTPEAYNSILNEITKAWGEGMAPLFNKRESGFKSDLTNAAYRVGAKQVLAATKGFFLQQVRKHYSEESKVRIISDLLETEIGEGLMAAFIGMAISQIPQLKDSPKTHRLLKEFRVSGITQIGNVAFDTLVKGLIPVVSEALQQIDKAEKPALIEDLARDLPAEETAPLQRQS